MSMNTFAQTRPHVGGQWTSSPALLHVLSFILHALLPQPLLLLSSQRQRHKGCLCFEPSASLEVLSSDRQWDMQPHLSTCTDVEELTHCFD